MLDSLVLLNRLASNPISPMTSHSNQSTPSPPLLAMKRSPITPNGLMTMVKQAQQQPLIKSEPLSLHNHEHHSHSRHMSASVSPHLDQKPSRTPSASSTPENSSSNQLVVVDYETPSKRTRLSADVWPA
ncbi:hypothetical protein GZH46_02958, partial [Fragariocoptes setiger]